MAVLSLQSLAFHSLQSLAVRYLQVLVKELRFQQKPFEWAYEGLAPLLLRDVLRSRRGIGISLALLGSAVGARLGLCLLPLPARLTGGRMPARQSACAPCDAGWP